MNKNQLKYLGLLGFLGLLGIFTNNVGFYGFFGFFGFFGFANIKYDERLQENINKSARNTFVTTLLVLVGTMVLGSLWENVTVFFYGFIIIFVQHILVFTLSFQYYDRGGR